MTTGRRLVASALLAFLVAGGASGAESSLNLGGELKMRYRFNFEDKGSSPGFSFYEAELFIDGEITEYSQYIIEYNLMHGDKPDPENVWIDLHQPFRPAYRHGGRGVRIGNFQVPFGYENDDNEGYFHQGRGTVNHSLIHGERIDGWRMRERAIGICGAYSLGPVTAWAGTYNGNGSWLNYGESDNRRFDLDYAGKAQIQVADVEFGGAYWFAPGVDTTAPDYNRRGLKHTRDITRYGVHARYPASALFLSQDAELGGKPFLLFGEFIMGEHKATYAWDESGQQKMMGFFVEAQVPFSPWFAGLVRADYYDPNTDADGDEVVGLTPAIQLRWWKSMALILEYEFYSDNDKQTGLSLQDRIAAEIAIVF